MEQELLKVAVSALTVFIMGVNTPSVTPAKNITPQPTEFFHQVQKEDSLSSLASKYYGNGDYWTVVWNDNEWIENPNIIYSEWKIKIRPQKPKEPEPLRPQLAARYFQNQTPIRFTAQRPTFIPSQNLPPSSFDQVYQEAGSKYGIPWQILYGIHLTETGLRNGNISNYQGSGAQGPMQFMPGTWQAYGVDADGDGVANINSAVDAINGAANFIAKHGSVENGLKYYGGNTYGTLAAARNRGYSL